MKGYRLIYYKVLSILCIHLSIVLMYKLTLKIHTNFYLFVDHLRAYFENGVETQGLHVSVNYFILLLCNLMG